MKDSLEEGSSDLSGFVSGKPLRNVSDAQRGAAARMLTILGAYDHGFSSGTAKELADRTGIPQSSLFRLVRRLTEAGLLAHDDDTGRFAPGVGLLALGDIALRELHVPRGVQRILDELQVAIQENASLSIWRGGSARTCVAVSHSSNTLREFTAVGETYDIWLGAAGKAILSGLREADLERILAESILDGIPTSGLLRELDGIRATGVAITEGERIPGVLAVAAAVSDGRAWYGSVAVSGPSFRMTPKVDELVPVVRSYADRLSSRLEGVR